MNERSSAKHGMFYITNVLVVGHDDVTEGTNSVCGGGVSLHYSQSLQLLFFSYAQGQRVTLKHSVT